MQSDAHNLIRYHWLPDHKFLVHHAEWDTIPMPIATFLSQYNFAGKTIAPFCTNEGSGLGLIIADIKELCPKSIILNGLANQGQ